MIDGDGNLASDSDGSSALGLGARPGRAFDRCRQAYEGYEFHLVYHRVLDLCTVDLSAIYIDVSKDTIYIEAPASRARRSAQTAMYEILRGLVSTMAPILSFTADEIYEAMPGAKEQSVHLTELPRIDVTLTDCERQSWDRILQLRDAVTKVIEPARAAKQIGQSPEADITLFGDFSPEKIIGDVNVDLAKIFIVSHVTFKPLSEFTGEPIEIKGLGKTGIGMAPARGKKCGRCWNYREEVLVAGNLCARCDAIVIGLTPAEVPMV